MEEERLPPAAATDIPPPQPLRPNRLARRSASQDVSSPRPPRPPPDNNFVNRKLHASWDSAAFAHDDVPTLPSEEPFSPINSGTPLTAAETEFSERTGGDELILPPLPPPPGHNTYVVQMPKDIIYRVPPPENAMIVERFQQPDQKKRRCGCISCRGWLYILLGVFIFLLIVGATLGGLYLYLSPKNPEFTISAFAVKHGKNNNTSYEASLEAKNVNDKLGLSYENVGDVSLAFDTNKIAGGKFPSFYQEKKNTTTLKIALAGSSKDDDLPKEVQKSLKETKTQVPIWLTVNVDDVPIRKKAWTIYLSSVNTDVTCDFRVSSLTTDIKIVSQNCKTQW